MAENQKEDQVVTNNKSGQQNQGNQSNQDFQKKSGDVSQMPNVEHEDKFQTQVPKKHNTDDEQERSRKNPVAGQEQQEEGDDENQQEEFGTQNENQKRNNS